MAAPVEQTKRKGTPRPYTPAQPQLTDMEPPPKRRAVAFNEYHLMYVLETPLFNNSDQRDMAYLLLKLRIMYVDAMTRYNDKFGTALTPSSDVALEIKRVEAEAFEAFVK